LKVWCKQHKIEVICTELEVKNGLMTGNYINGDCSGKQKAKQILKKYNISDFNIVYAYGDSKEDFELLKLADKKYFRWQEIEELKEIYNC
jgi:phosphatidylglycerophosphatase C